MSRKRICIEKGCDKEAGTPWTQYWCRECDEKRRARITKQLEEISAEFTPEESP